MNKESLRSPIDQSVVAELPYDEEGIVLEKISNAKKAQASWSQVSFNDRLNYLKKFNQIFLSKREFIGERLTLQMGRPIQFSPKEVDSAIGRSEKMLELLSKQSFQLNVEKENGVEKFMDRVPLGTCLIFGAWNYPLLTVINSIIPALLCGNTVLLKHSTQTLLCGVDLEEAFKEAGLPEGVFQLLNTTYSQTPSLLQNPDINYVVYTGSVAGGRLFSSSRGEKFMNLGLELGGKDPAYVMGDADITNAAANLADGAFFNSGQSCCGVERIYVHDSCYDNFLEALVQESKNLKVGDPREPDTYMGPLAKESGVQHVLKQVDLALKAGAKPLLEDSGKSIHLEGQYLRPEIYCHVNHEMDLMKEETFGPVVGVMKVSSDEEALHLMNDSQYGLTASLWGKDKERIIRLGKKIETGTVMMNRCDYVDPALAWTGVKDTGIGFALSELSINVFTRPKSYLLMGP